MEDNKQIGYPANIEVSDNTSFWVEGDCMDSPKSPIRLKNGQLMKVHKFDGFSPFADLDKVRGKVCVILYKTDGLLYGAVKEIVGIDEVSNALRLKYYYPQETIVSLRIDKIQYLYFVDGVEE